MKEGNRRHRSSDDYLNQASAKVIRYLGDELDCEFWLVQPRYRWKKHNADADGQVEERPRPKDADEATNLLVYYVD